MLWKFSNYSTCSPPKNFAHHCKLIHAYYHGLSYLSKFPNFCKIRYRLPGSSICYPPHQNTHYCLNMPFIFTSLALMLFFLLINLIPSRHSMNITGSVKTFIPQAEFNSSSPFTNSLFTYFLYTLFVMHTCGCLCACLWDPRWHKSHLTHPGTSGAWSGDRHSGYWVNGKILSETHVLCQHASSNITSRTKLRNKLQKNRFASLVIHLMYIWFPTKCQTPWRDQGDCE